MKLTRKKIRRLISEAILKELGSIDTDFLGTMSDIGSPMVKQLATYLIPYQGRVSFEIEDSSIGIDIKMFLDGAQVGYIGADFMADMCSNCYMVGMSSTAAGEERNDNNLYGFRLDLIKDDLFKIGSYGPILYELCLELISLKGKDSYMTCDKNSLDPAAYNVYAYYFYKRPDVITKQLDPERVPVEFRITPNDPTDDCESHTSEEYYLFNTSKGVHPQGPDDDPAAMYGEYIDYVKSKDPIMKGYRKNSTPFLNLVKELEMII